MKVLALPALLICAMACTQTPAQAEWRILGALGTAITDGSNLSVSQGASDFTVDSVHWSERSLLPAIHYDVRAEYYSTGHPLWGLFVELNHMKVHAQTGDVRHIHGVIDGARVDTNATMNSVIGRFNVAHGVNFIGVGVVRRWRWRRDTENPNGRVQPYVGASVGPVVNHPDSNVLGQDHYGPFAVNRQLGGQFMAGIHYSIGRSWGIFTETKVTHVDDEVPIGGGHASMRLDSIHANMGISYTF